MPNPINNKPYILILILLTTLLPVFALIQFPDCEGFYVLIPNPMKIKQTKIEFLTLKEIFFFFLILIFVSIKKKKKKKLKQFWNISMSTSRPHPPHLFSEYINESEYF
jgi:hypothetical protein